MKNTKANILKKSLVLFNNFGVADISIRQIASEIGISHSNLIYHYKTKNDIIEALHQQLLENAVGLNRSTKTSHNFVRDLFESTKKGFEILYDYRFLMIDLNHIMRENEKLKQVFLEVEKIRATMYKEVIDKAVQHDYMREELYPTEYDTFIEHIKIFSDFWISSSAIYDNQNKKTLINKYTRLFVQLFFPFLTEKGRKELAELRL